VNMTQLEPGVKRGRGTQPHAPVNYVEQSKNEETILYLSKRKSSPTNVKTELGKKERKAGDGE